MPALCSAALADSGTQVRFFDGRAAVDVGEQVSALATGEDGVVVGTVGGRVLLIGSEGTAVELYAHEKKVVAVAIGGGLVASGSWDNTAVVAALAEDRRSVLSRKTFPHALIVWAVCIHAVPVFMSSDDTNAKKLHKQPENEAAPAGDEYLVFTGCADGTVKVIHKSAIVREFRTHEGPVRGIVAFSESQAPPSEGTPSTSESAASPPSESTPAHSNAILNNIILISVDNYGFAHRVRLLPAKVTVEAIRPTGAFLYAVSHLPGNRLALCGDTSAILIADRHLKIETELTAPDSAFRTLCPVNDTLHLLSMDGQFFSQSGDTFKPFSSNQEPALTEPTAPAPTEQSSTNAPTASSNNTEPALSTTPETPSDNATTLPAPAPPTFFESGGVKYKVEARKVYANRAGAWELLGDQMDTTANSEHPPAWEHTVPVELGSKTFLMNFNSNERPKEIAARFLAENRLGAEHEEDIVEFINTNFKACAYTVRDGMDWQGLERLAGAPLVELLKKAGRLTWAEVAAAERLVEALPLFARYDVWRFLLAREERLDLAGAWRGTARERREGRAWAALAVNAVREAPWWLGRLEARMRALREAGLVGEDEARVFEENLRIRRKKPQK